MKIKDNYTLNDVNLYDPFVHFCSDEGNDFAEILVQAKEGEEVQSSVKLQSEGVLIIVVNINKPSVPTNSNEPKFVYDRVLLPSIEDPDTKIIVMVVYDDPEEGGTATIRYRDLT